MFDWRGFVCAGVPLLSWPLPATVSDSPAPPLLLAERFTKASMPEIVRAGGGGVGTHTASLPGWPSTGS